MKTLSLEQTADMLHCSAETVSEAIRFDGLPAAKVGRAWVLVDEDVIKWLRSKYGSNECESTPAANEASSGPTSPSQANALRAALEPRREKRRRNGPPELQSISGGRGTSAKSPG